MCHLTPSGILLAELDISSTRAMLSLTMRRAWSTALAVLKAVFPGVFSESEPSVAGRGGFASRELAAVRCCRSGVLTTPLNCSSTFFCAVRTNLMISNSSWISTISTSCFVSSDTLEKLSMSPVSLNGSGASASLLTVARNVSMATAWFSALGYVRICCYPRAQEEIPYNCVD